MTATTIAVYHALGSGRLLITKDHAGYMFTITGRTNTISISDGEAAALAAAIAKQLR